jgi:hypothetical protein
MPPGCAWLEPLGQSGAECSTVCHAVQLAEVGQGCIVLAVDRQGRRVSLCLPYAVGHEGAPAPCFR